MKNGSNVKKGNYDTPSQFFIVVPSHDPFFVGVLIGVAPDVA